MGWFCPRVGREESVGGFSVLERLADGPIEKEVEELVLFVLSAYLNYTPIVKNFVKEKRGPTTPERMKCDKTIQL